MADPRPKCNLLPFTNKFFASSASRSSCSEHVQALRDEVKAEPLKGMFRGPWGLEEGFLNLRPTLVRSPSCSLTR